MDTAEDPPNGLGVPDPDAVGQPKPVYAKVGGTARESEEQLPICAGRVLYTDRDELKPAARQGNEPLEFIQKP